MARRPWNRWDINHHQCCRVCKKITKATVIYYFDAKAPPESVWNFGKDTKVRCPGKAPMPVDHLRKAEVIVPFKMGQKFTAGLESKFQAHKIFEKQAFKELDEHISKEALENAVAKAPSIILEKSEHEAISAALAAAWREQKKKVKRNLTKVELRRIYEDVYRKNYPQWLEAIDSYLR